ncbi:unnamed protein product [Paramecium sonneborni]|uniref:Uncharacterized protein n=1 Tax=Paramecium sonneborni TaxID=65129 RepID=A0A8S1R6Z7_9CILI|nr:unnamed protein product [Paramecium sonneborni]
MKKIIKIYREQLGDQGHKINSNVQKDQDQTQNQNSIQQEQIGFYKIVIHLNSKECLKLMNNLKDDRREQQIKKRS